MVSVTDLFAPTIFGLKPGAEHGEGDGLVGSTWGFSSWGRHSSVALAVVT